MGIIFSLHAIYIETHFGVKIFNDGASLKHTKTQKRLPKTYPRGSVF